MKDASPDLVNQRKDYDSMITAYDANTEAKFFAGYPLLITPTSDDSPFFFEYGRRGAFGLPGIVQIARHGDECATDRNSAGNYMRGMAPSAREAGVEGETRQFLTLPEARRVVAVTCASRLELFGAGAPDAAPDGELRFRNPAHPAARTAALAPAVMSSV